MTFKSQPIVLITRRITFSSAHQLLNINLSDEENLEIFGKCFNPNGHGHNYTLEVTLKAPISEKTGMVINLSQLKKIMIDEIKQRFDHKHLNKDVDVFKKLNPTAENIVVVIWEILRETISESQLHKIKLIETENNFVEFYGEYLNNN